MYQTVYCTRPNNSVSTVSVYKPREVKFWPLLDPSNISIYPFKTLSSENG